MDFQHHQHNERCAQNPEVCGAAVGLSHFTHAVLHWLEKQRDHENFFRILDIEQKIRFN